MEEVHRMAVVVHFGLVETVGQIVMQSDYSYHSPYRPYKQLYY